MELKPLKKIQFQDFAINRMQGHIDEAFNQLKPNPFLIGNIIETSITASGVTLDHGLAQEPTGWLILDKTTNANIWRTAWDSRTISLDSSATSTIKIWVF